MQRLRAFALAALTLSPSVAAAEVNGDAILAQRPPRQLSEFGFFTDLAAQVPAEGVTPYNVASPLFTDYAEKLRFVYATGPAPYQTDAVLDLPVGSALIKTFHYGDRLVETRVLLHQEGGWTAFPYVWNAEGTDADLKIAGADIALDTPHGQIDYRVPNFNQCKACHVSNAGTFSPIGPRIRTLNTGDQLAVLVRAGVLSDAPSDAPAMPDYTDESLPVIERARAYLDINCGHCHAPGHPADTSGLYLTWEETRDIHLGINKRPVAAGRGSGGFDFDILPGEPDASILTFRLASVDPGIMMPELGRSMVHAEGLALIRAYIEALGQR